LDFAPQLRCGRKCSHVDGIAYMTG